MYSKAILRRMSESLDMFLSRINGGRWMTWLLRNNSHKEGRRLCQPLGKLALRPKKPGIHARGTSLGRIVPLRSEQIYRIISNKGFMEFHPIEYRMTQ